MISRVSIKSMAILLLARTEEIARKEYQESDGPRQVIFVAGNDHD
jgi:hypothetical protein